MINAEKLKIFIDTLRELTRTFSKVTGTQTIHKVNMFLHTSNKYIENVILEKMNVTRTTTTIVNIEIQLTDDVIIKVLNLLFVLTIKVLTFMDKMF